MTKLPRMTLKKLDPAKVFNTLHIVDTSNMNLLSNYYMLTPDQRAFVDEIINICESKFQEQIDEYNEDLVDHEMELEDELNELESKAYDKHEDN